MWKSNLSEPLLSQSDTTEETTEFISNVSGISAPKSGLTPGEFNEEHQQALREGVFGTEQEPKDPPLTEMEIELLRRVEKPKKGEHNAPSPNMQARAMAALSTTATVTTPKRCVVEDGPKVNFKDLALGDPFGTELTTFVIEKSLSDPVSVRMDGTVATGGLPLSDYKLDKVIGQGCLGNVVLATDRKDRSVVIKKIYLANTETRNTHIDNALREAALQGLLRQTINDPPIVCDLKEVIIANDTAYVVMEACDGSLETMFKGDGKPSLDEGLTMLRDLAEMYQKMHAMGIIHGDLNGKNILFKTQQTQEREEQDLILLEETEPLAPKLFIADFGLSGKPKIDPEPVRSRTKKKDVLNFCKMIMLEFIPAMTDLKPQEKESFAGLFSGLGLTVDFGKCRDYDVPQPNCLTACFYGRNPATKFSKLINLVGQLERYEGEDPMGWCMGRLNKILNE